jgi:hypothetical protein
MAVLLRFGIKVRNEPGGDRAVRIVDRRAPSPAKYERPRKTRHETFPLRAALAAAMRNE